MLIRKDDDAGWRRTEIASTRRDKYAPSFPAARILKNRIHNFSFPTMSWGSHRIFRCVNSVPETGLSGAELTAMETQRDTRRGKRKYSSPEKLHTNSPLARVCGGKEVDEGGGEEASASAVPVLSSSAAKPWNLRTRRSAGIAPGENDPNRYHSFQPSHKQFGKDNLRLDDRGQKQRPKFTVSLSFKEIEEDFNLFKGTKPHRRPQKRAKIVQRQLDELFPGLCLDEVTLDSYIVAE